MNYLNHNYLRLVVVLCIIVLQSCKKPVEIIKPEPPVIVIPDPKPEVKPKYFDVDTWIYQQMVKFYLWEKDMPHQDSTDKNLAPIDYFNSLISKDKDRYSYAKDNFNDIADYWNGNLKSYGFRFTKFSSGNANMELAVSLVLKGSPAEEAGLVRGDIIKEINGTVINITNYKELLAADVASFKVSNSSDSIRNFIFAKRQFQINPLQYFNIYKIGEKKVGYLVYTQFLFDYEEETRRIFKFFKENAIDEMIIDLRFNPGGVTPNAEVIASLLGPDLGTTVELFHGTSNEYQSNQNLQETGSKQGKRYFTNETSNLSQLNRIFVLTSNSSASSSEMIINCLKPYRQVYTVGGHTYGKNLISIIVRDETGKYPFTLMPAWTTIINANGQSDYGNKGGIAPDFPIMDDILPYKPLGDPEETLLKAAFEIILGKSTSGQQKQQSLKRLDNFHYFDSGEGFLGNSRYN